MLQDTIAAIATPIGEGGVAVLRLSGSQALTIAERCFQPAGKSSVKPAAAASHTLHFGHITHNGRTLDEVLLAVMRAPRTFTREDVVEITCHGGVLPAKLILDALIESGARLAEPGEFTRRAFLNGRIDLTQAEAVADLIHSRTELALQAANEQLAGSLSRRVNALRDQLMECLAHIEAHIDFPEEDITPDTSEQLQRRLGEGIRLMDELLATANEGRILRRGIRAAIVGRPNAGKSSLLNRLLGQDRAIVSHIAGPTRDTIEETANIRGIPVVFIDTAGLRHARDEIEAEGVRRSERALESAELVLHVIDVSASSPEPPALVSNAKSQCCITVLNKIDLPIQATLPDRSDFTIVKVSCATGQGIEALKDQIQQTVWAGRVQAGMLQATINARHQDALTRARSAAVQAASALQSSLTLELVAIDLRIAANAVGELVGKTTTEDLLDGIFSQFCIGK